MQNLEQNFDKILLYEGILQCLPLSSLTLPLLLTHGGMTPQIQLCTGECFKQGTLPTTPPSPNSCKRMYLEVQDQYYAFIMDTAQQYPPHLAHQSQKAHHELSYLFNALSGNSSVNTVQHATIEEAVFQVQSDVTTVDSNHDMFSVNPTDTPIGLLDSNHMTCVYCRFMSLLRLCNESCALQID
jgi:hypothetical protein